MDIVYCLRRPGEAPRYVGQTKTEPLDRLRRHYTAARCGSSYPVHAWLRKHADVEIIILVKDAVWNVDEQAAIRVAKQSGLRLLNCTNGGEGLREPSAETRAKMSAARRGVPKSEAHKAAISRANKGQTKNNGHRGMKRSVETRLKMSGSCNRAAIITEAIAREIKSLTVSMQIKDISISLGISYGIVHAVATGRTWSHVHG